MMRIAGARKRKNSVTALRTRTLDKARVAHERAEMGLLFKAKNCSVE
jgi:hypothetical protein